MKCQTPGCTRTPKPEWAYCPDCADVLIRQAFSSRPVEPEWVRRMRTRGLPAKDYSAA